MATKLVEATESFSCEHEGREVLITVGTRVAATHPIAKAHAALFTAVTPKADLT